MALTDGLIFVVVAQAMVYFVLYTHKIRLWRIVGAGAMIMVGFSALAIEDTLPASIFAGISLIVGGIQLFKDVASLVKK